MNPAALKRLARLEGRQRCYNRSFSIMGPRDMDAATALRLLKCPLRAGDTVHYHPVHQPGLKPYVMGYRNLISDADWEAMPDYPRVGQCEKTQTGV